MGSGLTGVLPDKVGGNEVASGRSHLESDLEIWRVARTVDFGSIVLTLLTLGRIRKVRGVIAQVWESLN